MKSFLKPNSTILFQGDSITDCGRNRETSGINPAEDLGNGYPAKIAAAREIFYPDSKIHFVNRGISGSRVKDLLERYEKDFKALKPDLVSILIGINDTWRRYDKNDPTDTEIFENQYHNLLKNLKRDLPGTKIVIIEPFLLDSDPGKKHWREDLDPKIQAVRRLAKEYADYFIPMDGIFASHAVAGIKEAEMAADGVHPTPLGHGIIASHWLKILRT